MHTCQFKTQIEPFAIGFYSKREKDKPDEQINLESPDLIACEGQVLGCACGVQMFYPFRRNMGPVVAVPFRVSPSNRPGGCYVDQPA